MCPAPKDYEPESEVYSDESDEPESEPEVYSDTEELPEPQMFIPSRNPFKLPQWVKTSLFLVLLNCIMSLFFVYFQNYSAYDILMYNMTFYGRGVFIIGVVLSYFHMHLIQ